MPLALSDRLACETFDDRNNMLLIPNLIDVTFARFAFCVVFTSRLVGIVIPFVCSLSIRYTHFLCLYPPACPCERACYRLNLRLSYAIILCLCMSFIQRVAERY